MLWPNQWMTCRILLRFQTLNMALCCVLEQINLTVPRVSTLVSARAHTNLNVGNSLVSQPEGVDTRILVWYYRNWRESKGTFHAWNFKVVVKIFLGKFPENLKSRKFPKSKPHNQKFWKLWDENEMEKTFLLRTVLKLGIACADVLFSKNSGNFQECKPEMLVKWKKQNDMLSR